VRWRRAHPCPSRRLSYRGRRRGELRRGCVLCRARHRRSAPAAFAARAMLLRTADLGFGRATPRAFYVSGMTRLACSENRYKGLMPQDALFVELWKGALRIVLGLQGRIGGAAVGLREFLRGEKAIGVERLDAAELGHLALDQAVE